MSTSQNGWSARKDLPIRPLVVAGESFSPGIRDDDDVYTVLQYVAEQLHKRVEPIVREDWHQADDWGFFYRANANDPNSLSNHSSGTAIDYNATRHPNGVPTVDTFTAKQIDEIHQILDEVDHVVRWGGDYTGTPDAMHFEINAGPIAVGRVAKRLNAPDLRLATFNVHVGQRGLKLRRNIRRMWKDAGYPNVIALQEAHGLKRGFWRYKRHAVDNFPRKEAKNCQILVRRDTTWLRRRLLAVIAPDWIGPKPESENPKTHPARVFVGGVVDTTTTEGPWETLCVHRATSSDGQNRKTRKAEHEQLLDYVNRLRALHPNRPIVLIGDWNGIPLGLSVELEDAELAMHGVDGALSIGTQCLSVRVLDGKYGSDHHPVVIDLKES